VVSDVKEELDGV